MKIFPGQKKREEKCSLPLVSAISLFGLFRHQPGILASPAHLAPVSQEKILSAGRPIDLPMEFVQSC